MNYFHMLEELSEKYLVWLCSSPEGQWRANVIVPTTGRVIAYGEGPKPQDAIRRAYLDLFPVKKNNRSGKLTQI